MADTFLIKCIIVGAFLLILVALGAAGLNLFGGKDPKGTSTVKALTVRVALSFGLIIMLLILNHLGLIAPNS
ncbi:MAG: DUF2909 family protein [Gammaproteobacteria bacterium]|jgi:hypothetical protein|nr:DUF2909 domain-containing protein [Pseudomonadota bacterium]MDG2302341.1 DUF2909 family protein [Gammaproteobacteria bacterium]MBT5065477.1 DUF2909 domain-containing protein [Pseudomonadota bacterium]MBT6193401.1 DUF2909 domain-containing protein [Pseudomonadota bacterium]MBT6464834.1 DUF2909 domain-containing protein [Pseudomonadota bacterium]